MGDRKNRNSIRAEILQKRDKITPAERSTLSKRITSNLIDRMLQRDTAEHGYTFHAVMVYLSMKSEVQTWKCVETLIKQDRKIIAPVVDTNSRNLIPKHIENLDIDLVMHQYGMFQPQDRCADFPLDQLQLIIVPGIAFDRKGYRLGYGKGFYDRFLQSCPNAVTVGLAYQLQIVDDTYPQPWDIPVQHIFTEDGIISGINPNKFLSWDRR